METWRLRTPNEWEPLSHWADLLMWRNHMYNTVINVFRNLAEMAPQLHQVRPPLHVSCGTLHRCVFPGNLWSTVPTPCC